MKHRRIIQGFISVVMLLNLLLCFEFSFNNPIPEAVLNSRDESLVASRSTPYENALLGNHPVSAPAPYLTNFTGGSFSNGSYNKYFNSGILCDSYSDISFFNFYLNEKTQIVLQPSQLHLTFCVLRI